MTQSQSAAHHLLGQWEESGLPLLVINPLQKKEYKEVMLVVEAIAKRKGWGKGRRQMSIGGFKTPQHCTVISREPLPVSFTKSAEGNWTYTGEVSVDELKRMEMTQREWVSEACSHLKQVGR